MAMDEEAHKLHKYLDRVVEIMEGKNSKYKRN